MKSRWLKLFSHFRLPWVVHFLWCKNFQKICIFYANFSRKTQKNVVFGLKYCEFSKNFYAKLFPINFYVPLCSYLETRKNFFFVDFLRVCGPKKIFFLIFSGKQLKSIRNYFLIIFKQFPAISDEICIFFH